VRRQTGGEMVSLILELQQAARQIRARIAFELERHRPGKPVQPQLACRAGGSAKAGHN